MQKDEITRFFCPFAREICRGGRVQLKERVAARCQFWDSDYSQCSLGDAIGGLRESGVISSALRTLASK